MDVEYHLFRGRFNTDAQPRPAGEGWRLGAGTCSHRSDYAQAFCQIKRLCPEWSRWRRFNI